MFNFHSMKSGINRVEFYNNEYYDENFLDKLVAAASEVLGESVKNSVASQFCRFNLQN